MWNEKKQKNREHYWITNFTSSKDSEFFGVDKVYNYIFNAWNEPYESIYMKYILLSFYPQHVTMLLPIMLIWSIEGKITL
jgi:hypothetical protein